MIEADNHREWDVGVAGVSVRVCVLGHIYYHYYYYDDDDDGSRPLKF